ncbi:MAG: hypothetical protein J6M31_07835 [Bacteroidales bacterium]|nr:hypothetical protein [Bacteroidales bacterium]
MKTLLSDIYWGVDNTAIDLSISDAVVSMFLDAYTMISEDSVLEIANDYVEIISDSHALSVEEEREVYSALSVAVNTTYYWSQRLGR